jgi:hypothetical protein
LNIDAEASLIRLRRVSWAAVGVFTLGAAYWGRDCVLGTVSGGVLAMVGLEAIARLVGRLTRDRPGSGSWLGVFGLLFRYILLCIALFVIIGVWHANVVAVALGFSAPVAAVFVECSLYAYQAFEAEREPRR